MVVGRHKNARLYFGNKVVCNSYTGILQHHTAYTIIKKYVNKM